MKVNICDALVTGLSMEAITWPKPGLVTSLDSGCHNDMNILSFIKSAVNLRHFFEEAYRFGQEFHGNVGGIHVLGLRNIGIRAEMSMFDMTRQVNVHKGAIFISLLLSCAAGYIELDSQPSSIEGLLHFTPMLAKQILEDDLLNNRELTCKRELTIGEKAYLQYGLTGVRGIAANGFKCILEIGMPLLIEALARSNSLRLSIVQLFMTYASIIEDTTILNRGFSLDRIKLVNQLASDFLGAGGIFTEEGERLLKKMEMICIKNNISIGGSADLVAATLALYFWHYGYPPDDLLW